MNLPQRHATWVSLGAGVFLCLLSLRWLFLIEDTSNFILFFVSGILFLTLAYFFEREEFLTKKTESIEKRLDSLEYPVK